jgi:uncharacterized protein YcbK (DUF882 family)
LNIPLTKNFKKSEFMCHDGTEVPPELMDNLRELVHNLQIIRDHLGGPVHVVSGYRTSRHNRRIGGARKSQHLKAKAADIRVYNMTPEELAEVVINLIKDKKIKSGGIGVYQHFVHYDTRGRNTRWKGKGNKDLKRKE